MRILLAVVYILGGFAAVVPSLMSAMMFDAPGSDNAVTLTLALSVASFPFTCWLGALLLFFRNRWWHFVPFYQLLFVIFMFCVLEFYCDGKFSC